MSWEELLQGLRAAPWRLLLDPPAPGAWNMAVDEALLQAAEVPTVRVYSWAPPCLSLGWLQKDGWVDREACRAAGVQVVRRPTGGRALLHEPGEITYAVALPTGGSLSTGESFRGIAGAVGRALAGLGLPVEVAPACVLHRGEPNLSCLRVIQEGEVVAGGRKLVGSAQARRGSRLLQHGALPRRVDAGLLARLVPDALPGQTLEGLGREGLEPERFARAMGRALGVDLVEGGLTAREREWARRRAA